MRTIPVDYLRACRTMARRRGWNIDDVLIAAGIAPALLDEGRSRVTAEQLALVVQKLWRRTDDELMGLGRGPVPRGTFRLICYGLISSPDLRTALTRCDEFVRVIPGLPPISVTVSDRSTRIAFDVPGADDPEHLFADTVLAVAHRFIGWVTGTRVPLLRVEFPYPEPASREDHDLIFGAPLVFDAVEAALVFGNEILSTPLVRDDEALAAYLLNSPADMLARRDYGSSLSDRVRRILEQGLRGEWPSAQDVAGRLAMSVPTLRRKLADEGCSVSQIKEDLLRDAAIAGLVRGEETVEELSERLGFSEPSAFRRAFRRWTGHPPGLYRRSAGSEPTADPA